MVKVPTSMAVVLNHLSFLFLWGQSLKKEETGKVFCDLVNDGDTFVIAKGGRGGRGNARFQTSANRAPTFAEKGEPGEEFWFTIRAKSISRRGFIRISICW